MSEHPPSESAPEPFSIAAFEARKTDTLRHYGCPEEELWLTECLTVDDFHAHHGDDGAFEGDLGVVYYHESGDVIVAVGFRDEAGFQKACEHVARTLARAPLRTETQDVLEPLPENPYPWLLSSDQWEQLARNGRESAIEEKDHAPVVRIVTVNVRPQMVWVLSEIVPRDPDIAFGVCDLGVGFPELGYVSLRDVIHSCSAHGVMLVTDPLFQPVKPVTEYSAEARARGHA